MTEPTTTLPVQVLLIEGNLELARVLLAELHAAGLRARWAADGLHGLQEAHAHHPHLVLLDLDLPDLLGDEVVRRLRLGARAPIMVLSNCDRVEDKVRLLTLGASDYLVKPVHPDELLARVQVQLRAGRMGLRRVGHLTLDEQRGTVHVRELSLPLTDTEFGLLWTLAAQPGRVFSYSELTRARWVNGLSSTSNALSVHLANLRAKLRTVGAEHLLHNVRGRGYTLREPD